MFLIMALFLEVIRPDAEADPFLVRHALAIFGHSHKLSISQKVLVTALTSVSIQSHFLPAVNGALPPHISSNS